jgi:tripartite-type tricarboxylate transporter receptor subunit TctC
VNAVKSASAKAFYESTGTESVVSSPEELGKFQSAESQKWGRIIKAAKIQPE